MTSAHPAPTAGAAPTPIAYDHVIVGGGMVADAAARGIRERDTADDTGAVVVVRTRVTALRPDAHELDTDAGDAIRLPAPPPAPPAAVGTMVWIVRDG